MQNEQFTLPCGILHEGSILRHVTLQEMTGKVTKELGRRDVRANPAKIVNSVLGECLVAIEGLENVSQKTLNDMLVADRDYCLFKARIVTLGPKLVRMAQCPHCQAKLDIEIDLETEVVFKELTDKDYEIVGDERIFPLKSLDDARTPWKAECRYPNGNDQAVVAKMAQNNPMEAEQHMAWRCLKTWDGQANPDRHIFEQLPLSVVNDFMAEFREALPGIDEMYKLDCFECGREFAVEFGPDFLLQSSARRKRR